jgi:hypothetical protein
MFCPAIKERGLKSRVAASNAAALPDVAVADCASFPAWKVLQKLAVGAIGT